jgi:hypothetical protein
MPAPGMGQAVGAGAPHRGSGFGDQRTFSLSFLVPERMALLDNLTRGRTVLGGEETGREPPYSLTPRTF